MRINMNILPISAPSTQFCLNNVNSNKLAFKAAIHDAAKCGDIERYRQEIAKGVDPNLRDEQGRAPLDHAISHRQYAMVEEISNDKRVDVNSQDFFGITALNKACWLSDRRAVQILCRREDIDVNKLDKIYNGPLISAMFNAVHCYEHTVKACCSDYKGFDDLYAHYKQYVEFGDADSDAIISDLLNRDDIDLINNRVFGMLLLDIAEEQFADAPWLDTLRVKTKQQLKQAKIKR